MPDYSNARKTELSEFEQQDQFLVHAQGDIAHILNDLSRRPDIITGYFDEGSRYILTAVISVLPSRGLVVLDPGPDQITNERLLQKGRLLCVTKHERIHIKFTLEGIQRARFQGEPVLAAPFPQSVFRLQRREFFRIKTPMVTPVTCAVQLEGERRVFPVLDIGYGGLALKDDGKLIDPEKHPVLEECLLDMPEFGEVTLGLEVRNIVPLTHRDSGFHRVGCSFRKMSLDRNAVIQRYIHQLQINQRATGGD